MEKKECFSRTTFGWSSSRMICSSLFLNRLSCNTRLMATISRVSKHVAWKTTPNDPLPTTRSAA